MPDYDAPIGGKGKPYPYHLNGYSNISIQPARGRFSGEMQPKLFYAIGENATCLRSQNPDTPDHNRARLALLAADLDRDRDELADDVRVGEQVLGNAAGPEL